MSFLIFSKLKSKKQAGFTLLELMVVVFIVTVIFSVILRRQSTFQDKFKIDEKVYDLALSIRKAQAYTLGVREFYCASNGTKTFDVSYGVNLNANSAADTGRFIFFIDANQDAKYNDASQSCYTETITLSTPGIDRICGVLVSGGTRCYSPLTGSHSSGPRQINIVYQRPDPKPVINFLNSGGNPIAGINPPAYAYFKYPNQSGEARVAVESTGQVSIIYCSTTCP